MMVNSPSYDFYQGKRVNRVSEAGYSSHRIGCPATHFSKGAKGKGARIPGKTSENSMHA
jgi:hypothetical protein